MVHSSKPSGSGPWYDLSMMWHHGWMNFTTINKTQLPAIDQYIITDMSFLFLPPR